MKAIPDLRPKPTQRLITIEVSPEMSGWIHDVASANAMAPADVVLHALSEWAKQFDDVEPVSSLAELEETIEWHAPADAPVPSPPAPSHPAPITDRHGKARPDALQPNRAYSLTEPAGVSDELRFADRKGGDAASAVIAHNYPHLTNSRG